MKEECAYKNNILALYLKTKGDFILVIYYLYNYNILLLYLFKVGDILRSLKLLVYKEELGLEEVMIIIVIIIELLLCFFRLALIITFLLVSVLPLK